MPAEHETAAGVAVEPMGERRRIWQTETQRIEAAFEIRTTAGTGVHGNPRRLVDDQDQPIPVQNTVCEHTPHSPAEAGPSRSPQCGERAG